MFIARRLILALVCIVLAPTVLADKVKDVNVVNTPTVNANIVSTNPVPVVVGRMKIEPFAKTVSGPFDGMFASEEIITQYEISPDKVLVVESVSWFLNIPADEKVLFIELEYNTEMGAGFVYPALLPPQISDADPTNARSFYTSLESVRLYLADLSSLNFRTQRQTTDSDTASASFVVTITGYLEANNGQY